MSQQGVLEVMRANPRPLTTGEIHDLYNQMHLTKIKNKSTIGVSLRRLRKWGDVYRDEEGRWCLTESAMEQVEVSE